MYSGFNCIVTEFMKKEQSVYVFITPVFIITSDIKDVTYGHL